MTTSRPAWLTSAMTREPRSTITTDGAWEHHRLEWGAPGRPAMILLHGGGAHAWWWKAVAGLLADEWHVVAPDMAGHGRTSHRPGYTFTGWVDQVMGIVDELASPGRTRPVVVGHSMCGVVAAMVGAAHGDRLGGVVVVDTPLGIPSPESIGHAEAIMAAPRYVDVAEALINRFRLLPAQPVVHPSLLAHLAEHAVTRVPEGWTWAFDPNLFIGHPDDRPRDVGVVLENARCPTAVIVADDSPVVPVAQRQRLGRMAAASEEPRLEVIVQPGHHHLMLDRPRELAVMLAGLASGLASGLDLGSISPE